MGRFQDKYPAVCPYFVGEGSTSKHFEIYCTQNPSESRIDVTLCYGKESPEDYEAARRRCWDPNRRAYGLSPCRPFLFRELERLGKNPQSYHTVVELQDMYEQLVPKPKEAQNVNETPKNVNTYPQSVNEAPENANDPGKTSLSTLIDETSEETPNLTEEDKPMETAITPASTYTPSEQYQTAVELHRQIMLNGELAANALTDLCKSLKAMRDKQLYSELGYDTFDAYVEGMVGIKARQAYTYISAYENLGSTVLQSNASLGITKLSLIVSVPATERAEFIEENDLGGMSTREIKEMIEKYKQTGEQLSLLTTERDEAKEQVDDTAAELERVRAQLKELQKKPVEVAVAQPSKEEIDKIRKEAEKDAKAKQKEADEKALQKALAEKDKEISEAKSAAAKQVEAAKVEAAAKAKEDVQASLNAVEQEKAAAIERARKLEQQFAISSNPDSVLFAHMFGEFQGNYNKLIEIIGKLDTTDKETAAKYRGAIRKYLDMLLKAIAAAEEAEGE